MINAGVSKLGFGCMGLTGVYNAPVPEEAGITIIKHAFEAGITFFDTADAYGPHTNEVLLGKALKQLPREKVQVATKCGIEGFDANGLRVKGTPDYVRASCKASLQRLDVDYIDLYYQHRIDQELGIGIVPYSPLGRGFFAGRAAVESIPSESFPSKHPRYTGENLEKNKVLYKRLEMLSKKYGCSPAQHALSWVLHQGEDVVPIPGNMP
ncbi:hypothetical protein PR202_ga00287 [Eleusine coracana subsp. coracana]|uniref:NADP-dependent oxidoreductase domain-containing protein n=1 Tax=Eleusine coracana subsp. coracana TaxID=191504 RepID=A0AAV5BF19_ELECO|nr:hypothetical protein PR202_ga00287 [Eleusine coracana subsp. coracana]